MFIGRSLKRAWASYQSQNQSKHALYICRGINMSAPETPALGRLEPVPLREAWQNEARDFTPWLAKSENIVLLGDAIGISQLEVMSQEKGVGPFRADIVCQDTTKIISNVDIGGCSFRLSSVVYILAVSRTGSLLQAVGFN